MRTMVGRPSSSDRPDKVASGLDGTYVPVAIAQGARARSPRGVRGKIENAKLHRTRSAAAHVGGREGALYCKFALAPGATPRSILDR